MCSTIRILIADDQAIAREGIQRILEREEDIEIVGIVQTAPEVLEQVHATTPDVVLLDLRWYHDDQAMSAVIAQLRRECPKTCIIGMTVYDHLMQPAKDAGAKWVITKDIDKNELVRLIRAAYAASARNTDAPPGASPSLHEKSARLCRNLVNHFSEEELHTLCFELGIDYEALPAVGKDGKAREFVAHLQRQERIPELVTICRNLRPNVHWEDMYAAASEP